MDAGESTCTLKVTPCDDLHFVFKALRMKEAHWKIGQFFSKFEVLTLLHNFFFIFEVTNR